MNILFLVSCSGSAAHFKNVHTSFANWLRVAGVPSEYSIISLYKAWAIPMAPPGKYGLKYRPSLISTPAGGSQYPVRREKI